MRKRALSFSGSWAIRVSDEKTIAQAVVTEIKKVVAQIGRPVKIMEVCGTHTVESP